MECNKDTATLNTVVERDRIFDFLAGLNAEFDPIRVQILGKEKFPDLNEVFYTVRSEETRHQAMLHEQPPDVSALVASKTTRQGPPPSSSKNVRDKFYCEHCNRSGHTKDSCFKLHGREQVLSRGGGSRNMHQYQAHVATHVQDTESFEKRGTDFSSFSQNDVERLKSMLDSMSKPSGSGSGSLAVTGKSLCSRSLTVCGNIPKNAWILDSGATNHMTFDSTLLCSYTTPSSIPYITVADGSHACVVGTGNIDLQPPFQLQSVLHDLTPGQTIGIAKEKEGLYYFSDDHPKSRIFGCVAFVHVHKQYRNKLDPRAVRCIFLGYAPNKRGYKCYHPPSQKFFVSKDVTFHENVSYFTRSQSQGENISDLESESESESEFLILGPSLPRTPISVPSLEPELSPSLSLSPSSTPESEPLSVPGPSRPSVLQESAPPAPTLVYQRRSKPDLLHKQIQSPESEVSTKNDSSSDDSVISDTCDTNPVDLPIALRKDKRSCPSLYRHPISQYVSTKHLSTQYQSFVAAVNSVKIPSSV
ncbi:hypothetical protein KIW84_013047 [Lathyrus oleraceus]|uniref:Retrovirus-related Pol polyprotein from transposon TNT 1-94 n=1 Tax=Pisum sativum TaxID=3888 RepID=A0A9D5BJD1_PEA|nr:hypothetical protein KIW84_013047 [Pisum sativum]